MSRLQLVLVGDHPIPGTGSPSRALRQAGQVREWGRGPQAVVPLLLGQLIAFHEHIEVRAELLTAARIRALASSYA
jgi:hypothetical protein